MRRGRSPRPTGFDRSRHFIAGAIKSAVQRRWHLAEARGAESTGVDRNRQESNLPVRRISPPRDAFAAELTFPCFRKVGGEIAKSRKGQTKKSGRQTKKSSGRSVAGGWTGEIGLVENRSPACGDSNRACGESLPSLWRFSSGLWLGRGKARGGSARNSIPVDSRRFPSTRLQVGPARASLYRLGVELKLSPS